MLCAQFQRSSSNDFGKFTTWNLKCEYKTKRHIANKWMYVFVLWTTLCVHFISSVISNGWTLAGSKFISFESPCVFFFGDVLINKCQMPNALFALLLQIITSVILYHDIWKFYVSIWISIPWSYWNTCFVNVARITDHNKRIVWYPINYFGRVCRYPLLWKWDGI